MARKTPEPLQIRHGTTAQAEATAGAPAELGADLEKKHIILYDGEKEGGYPAARADRKVSSATEGLTVNGGEEATLAGDIALADTRKWLKRVDELPEDTTELLADVPVGGAVVTPDTEPMQFPYEYPGPYNDEIWITESGTFIAPVTGEYEVTLTAGGTGGQVIRNTEKTKGLAVGGSCGKRCTFFVKLLKGQQVPVIVGAGGLGYSGTTWAPEGFGLAGGVTSFGGASTLNFTSEAHFYLNARNTNTELSWFGASSGGQDPDAYGGGGGAGANMDDAKTFAADGKAGVIHLRFFNPNKPH